MQFPPGRVRPAVTSQPAQGTGMHFEFSDFIGKIKRPDFWYETSTPEPGLLSAHGIRACPPDKKPVQAVRNLDQPVHNLDDEMQQLMLWYGQRFDFQTKLMNQQAFQASLADM